MRTPDTLWRGLDRAPALSGVKATWQEAFGGDLDIAEKFLQPEQEPATTYPCPRPGGDGCPRRVVEHGPDDLVAVCGNRPAECEPIKVTRQDLVVYRFDVEALAAAIGAAFGFDGGRAPVDGIDGVAAIGRYAPRPGHRFPAFFALPGDGFPAALELLVARAGGPCLVFVPSANGAAALVGNAHQARSVHVLACDECLAWDGRRLVCARPAEEILAPFRTLALPEQAQPPVTFPTPAGVKWPEVRMQFIDGHTLRASVRGESHVYTFSQMGMVDSRSGNPDKQWELLHTLADEAGSLTWDSRGADPKRKKQKELLSKTLRRFFGIDAEPFKYKKGEGWTAQFVILAEH